MKKVLIILGAASAFALTNFSVAAAHNSRDGTCAIQAQNIAIESMTQLAKNPAIITAGSAQASTVITAQSPTTRETTRMPILAARSEVNHPRVCPSVLAAYSFYKANANKTITSGVQNTASMASCTAA